MVEEKTKLTDRQDEVLGFIKGYMERYQSAPTVREIAVHFGVFINAAQCHVLALERKGWIGLRRNSGTHGRVGRMMRGIFLLDR